MVETWYRVIEYLNNQVLVRPVTVIGMTKQRLTIRSHDRPGHCISVYKHSEAAEYFPTLDEAKERAVAYANERIRWHQRHIDELEASKQEILALQEPVNAQVKG